MNNLSVAIIGGGRSARFGKPKSFARFRDRRLIEYSIELAGRLSSVIFIVSDSHLSYKKYKIKTVNDLISGCGPLCGVYTALHYADSEFVATIPIDVPLLPPEIYHILFNRMEPGKPVVAVSESGLEPLVAIWPRMVLSSLEMDIKDKRYSLYKTLRRLEAVHVFIPKEMENYSDDFFYNINYQQDLKVKLKGNIIMEKKLPEHFTGFQASYPDLAKIHEQLGEITKDSGPLDDKNIRLVKIALAISAGLEGAVHSHARQALEEGISAEEIRHVAILAISTVGFPRAMAGLSWINDEMEPV